MNGCSYTGNIRFMLYSAMRVGEARYLQFCDLEYLEHTNKLEHDNVEVIANENPTTQVKNKC